MPKTAVKITKAIVPPQRAGIENLEAEPLIEAQPRYWANSTASISAMNTKESRVVN